MPSVNNEIVAYDMRNGYTYMGISTVPKDILNSSGLDRLYECVEVKTQDLMHSDDNGYQNIAKKLYLERKENREEGVEIIVKNSVAKHKIDLSH